MILTSTGARRYLGSVVSAVVIAMALTFAGPSGAATAMNAEPMGTNGASTIICYPVKLGNAIVRIVCVPIYVQVRFELPCPPLCGPAFDWRNDPRILPESVENAINEMIVVGLVRLGDAAATTDPAARATYRSQAMNALTTAARFSMNTRLSLQQVGLASTFNNSFGSQPAPWHSWVRAAGDDIADGMTYLKQSLATPPSVGNPWLPLAIAQFDEAYTEFSQQRVIVG